jgi:hypothetical protein
VSFRTALVDLYRFEGSLLERRGIAAPGNEPVTPPCLDRAGSTAN